MLDKGYQDVKFYIEIRCADKCDTGVLLRAEKTSEGGWKGVYVAVDRRKRGLRSGSERRRKRGEPHAAPPRDRPIRAHGRRAVG
jgi:hypothetical protein